jgi:uncharacterized protein YlaI
MKKKPIITYYCNQCHDVKFFAIENVNKNSYTYKCKLCGNLIDFNKITMEEIV